MKANIKGSVNIYGLWVLTFTDTDEGEWAFVFASEEDAMKMVLDEKDDFLTWEIRPVANTLHIKLDEEE